MKAPLRRGLAALCALLAPAGCQAAPELAVVGDSVKVKEGADLPRRSALYAGGRVRLRAARGETLGVQVLLTHAVRGAIALDLHAKDVHIVAFRLDTVPVREPSTSMYGDSRGPGQYPDVLTPAPGGIEGQPRAYFDVAVGPAASPGRHTGELRIGSRRIPVELRIENARIDLRSDPLVWVYYMPGEVAAVHGLPDDDRPEQIEVEREYYELFRRHGALLAPHLGPHRFPPRRQFMKDVRFWPAWVDHSSDANIAADVRRWLELLDGSDVRAFSIPIDEPRTAEQRERVRHVAEVIGKAGGGRPSFLRAVTDAVHPVYGDSIDLYFSPLNIPEPANERRARGQLFWTYNGKPPHAGSMIIDTYGVALRTWGWIGYLYDVDLWYAWEGLYFRDRYNRGAEATDLLNDPVSFDERQKGGTDFGNGDGLLAYPGALPSLRLKALRRGLQDRLLLEQLEDCGQAAYARRVARALIPRALGEATGERAWPVHEAPWEEARHLVLDGIERHCPP